jgi:hypothetical protein
MEFMDALVRELTKDEDYFITWQSNLAMAFYDTAQEKGLDVPKDVLQEVSNDAARRFLDQLIYTTKPSSDDDNTLSTGNSYIGMDNRLVPNF